MTSWIEEAIEARKPEFEALWRKVIEEALALAAADRPGDRTMSTDQETGGDRIFWRRRANLAEAALQVAEREGLAWKNRNFEKEDEITEIWMPRVVTLAGGLRDLHNEVDCRIEHGAESNGHLEYVRFRLAALIEPDGKAGGRLRAEHPRVSKSDSMSADAQEALMLLGRWYRRWQGFLVGTPSGMAVRTRALLDKYDVPVHKDVKQR